MGPSVEGVLGGSSDAFFEVPASLYRPGDLIERDLYFLYQGQYVLYRLRNLTWKDEDDQRLKEFKISHLFIRFPQPKDHHKFLEEHLSKVLDSDKTSEKQKAELLYQTTASLVKDIFDAPQSPENIRRSMKSIKNTIHYLGKNKENFFHLMSQASKDFSEFSHGIHTSAYSIALAHQMGIRAFNQVASIGVAAMLHDIGKTKLDKALIENRGKLKDDEKREYQRHPRYSYEIAHDSRSIPELSEKLILQHHERPNGKGYPQGMQDDMHAFAKLISVCDCFDSLTSERSYEKAYKPLEAIEKMRTSLKEEYDQNILLEFIKTLKK